jgi:hypothetical protein
MDVGDELDYDRRLGEESDPRDLMRRARPS